MPRRVTRLAKLPVDCTAIVSLLDHELERLLVSGEHKVANEHAPHKNTKHSATRKRIPLGAATSTTSLVSLLLYTI